MRACKDFCPARSFLLKETCTCCFLTGWWRQWHSRAPITWEQQFRSRSPEGSIFSPHHHVKQVHFSVLVLVILISSPANRPDTTTVGRGLLERGPLTPWLLTLHKLILHHCFQFYCSKRTARLSHNVCHTVLSPWSLSVETQEGTQSSSFTLSKAYPTKGGSFQSFSGCWFR